MPPPEPPQHLPLDALTLLATRLVALPIFRRFDPTSSEGEVVRRFCPMLDTLRAVQPPPELSAFLASRLTEARAHLATLPPPETAAITPKLNAVRAALGAVNCATCAGVSGHRCDRVDERRDDAQIDATGLCLGVIRDMHTHVVASVQAALDTWTDVDREIPQVLDHRWATDWTGRAQFQFPTRDWKSGADTEFQDDAAGRLAEIRLALGVEELDWDSLLAVVWLFNHELLCHVRQVPAGPQPRQPCRAFCPFFEGWMDEVAHGVFEADLISGWLGASASVFVTAHRQEIIDAASDFRRDRYGRGPGANPRRLAAQWQLGAEAARVVRQFLERVSPEVDEGSRRRLSLAQMLTLSFRIQRLSTTPPDLDRMVNALMASASLLLSQNKGVQRALLLDMLTRPIKNKVRWIKGLEKLGGL
jgi:hypothetical protein